MNTLAATDSLTAGCPQCGATYQVPLAKLGPKGRSLKCAQCGHVWRVMHPTPSSDHAAIPTEAAPAAQPEPSPAAPALPTEAVPTPAPEAPVVAAVPESGIEEPPAPVGLEAPGLEDLTRPWWQVLWLDYVVGEQKWLTLALVLTLCGAIAGGVVLWFQLRPSAPLPPAPPAPAVMARPPLQATAPPHGVVLGDVSAMLVREGETPLLTIQGMVANSLSTTVNLPMLRAELLDDAAVVQDVQVITLASSTLPGLTAMPFAVSFTNPLGKQWRINWFK